MPSDRCKRGYGSFAVGRWYHFHEFGWHLGNVGSDRLVLTEREEQAQTTLWHSIYYVPDHQRATFLSGLSLGISPDSAHDIICCRSMLESLGSRIDVRKALSGCGGHEPESPEISDYVLHCVSNDLPESAAAMMPRY